MKFGTPVKLAIESLDDHGRGCGRLIDPAFAKASAAAKAPADKSAGRPACVYFVIPGETVEGTFAGRAKGVARLNDVRVASPSPDRVAPPCPHAGTCGGCAWQHIRYERQVELKRQAVDRAFADAGLDLRVQDIVPAEARLGYRNRMDYVFGPDGELGLKEPGRWDRPIDLRTCLLLSPDAVEILKRVKAWAASTSHRPWNNRRHEGYLRYAVIREGKFTGERMVILVTAAGELENAGDLIEALSPLCTSLYHGINPLVTDVSAAAELRLLHGSPVLRERISGIAYAIPPNAFFQTNSGMAAVLLEHVRGLAVSGPHRRLLDLYCGVGFFSLALAGNVEEALGIELDAGAIAAANANAEANGVGNARFRAEAAEALSWEDERPDVVIVDPPRSGLHPRVRETLLKHAPPRLIYVSCNYRALASDLKALGETYRIAESRSFDLFPQTPHVETVVHLMRNI